MSQSDQEFSTHTITAQLIGQIVDAIRNKAYGSIEIYIQDHHVVQITERTITKVGQSTALKKNYTREVHHPKNQDQQAQSNLSGNQ